ncbi:alpha/beta fold hydrolase [Aeromicrobium senzhongii]|uniref:Alpha/beta fold hydrolase n=1 Tax=Aeromicrobium senzhongii TaxID=2663859 RepID=A0ABX6SZE4_9ACTN|nr:alpha/beta hydrolase [Aeromicrobium senzhongii]MTB88445.1 alpha/beta fold hydrolase [Aeromicrobium senzhongii]QNL94590.1 alpha/beta fold hydrolase [Aeromicrobium senzhongii]
MKRFTIIALVSVLVVALVAGAVSAIFLVERQAPDPKRTDESAPAGLERFYGQDVTWTDCDDDRCTTVEVPIDYEKPDGETLRLAVRRVPATGKGGSAIFANPGGPGGSAQDFVGYLASELPDSLRRTHDVVGVDPRGVGQSTPLQCLSDRGFDAFIDTDPDPDDQAGIDALARSVRGMGEACRENSGELAAHVSTEEAARDHDIVRAVLGQKKMWWFGFSYGTQLGATYANLFPEKVERMVLDGAVDVSLDPVGQGLGQAKGFQQALTAYLEYCIEKGKCPVGDSVAEATTTITELMTALGTTPLKVDGRELSQGQAFYGIAMALYSQESWPYLTNALSGLVEGDGRVLLVLSDAYFERKQNGTYANNSGQVIYAVNCMDTDDAPDAAQTKALIPKFRAVSPVFGASLGWGVMACHDWPIKATHPQQAVKAEGAPPILVVGTNRDPATPYEWSVAMAEQLESGVLLTREGDGHTAYTSGNECIRKAVDAYFEDGTVPDDGTVCAEQ